MKKFLIGLMLASMYVLCSSFAFAAGTEKITLVEVDAESKSATINFGKKKIVVTPDSEIVEALSPDISTSAAAEFEAMTSKMEVAEVDESTKSLKKKIKSFIEKERKINFLLHTGMITMQGVDDKSQPTGFATTSDQSGNVMYYSLEVKHKWVGVEWRPSGREQTLPYMYNGRSPLGTLKVTTDNAVFLKVYPWSSSNGNVSIGVGKEHSTLDGNVSLGGSPLRSYLKGGGWATKLKFGAQFNVHKRVGLDIGYEKGGAEVVTEIPPILGVPKPITTTSTDLFTVGVTLKVL